MSPSQCVILDRRFSVESRGFRRQIYNQASTKNVNLKFTGFTILIVYKTGIMCLI